MTSINIKPEEYIFKFGKYINMRAVDVAEIYKVNPKTGQDEPVGLKYLKFLCDQDWFRHKDIIEKIIKHADESISEPEEPQKKAPKKKDPADIFHKKGEPKPEPKKKPMTKRMNPIVLSSDDDGDD